MISSTRNPSRTRHKSLESLVRLTAHAGFGGRLSGKGPNYRDLAGQPTLQLRPLGLPSWSDKLVGEVVRLLLEAYYEPRFSGRSHGFRPGRGCHTALSEVVETWKGTHWFIEGDISDCFGSLDHEIMVTILAENIHDGRFLRLIGHMLKAGYLEDWRWHATLSGAPQGGLCNAFHKPPYEQCRVMRSAGLLALVTATLRVEHCA
jgi:Reverse transcriptase (RNA-dependent DNA polymerase)